jgi:L-malate glycosyltransferase
VVSREQPFRLGDDQPGVIFHRVLTPSYPLFREPQYLLSLDHADRADLACDRPRHHPRALRDPARHRRVPGAADPRRAAAARRPKLVTTLHGTDITIVGSDPSYAETIGFSIDRSDGVTAVSESLKADTYAACRDPRHPVIPNFLDCKIHHRVTANGLRERFAGRDRAVVIHVSNFRPVKRVGAVIDAFARIRASVPSVLLLVGDGPDLPHRLASAASAAWRTTCWRWAGRRTRCLLKNATVRSQASFAAASS